MFVFCFVFVVVVVVVVVFCIIKQRVVLNAKKSCILSQLDPEQLCILKLQIALPNRK